MANRVLINANGLKISKPGVNVLTAGANGLLLDTSIPMLQIVQSGLVTGMANGSTRNITIPNLGFQPKVLASSQRMSVTVTHVNATTIQLYTADKWWLSSGSRNVFYAVTNVG